VLRRGQEQRVAVDGAALNEQQALHVFRTDRRIRIQRDDDGKSMRLEIVVSDD